MIKLIGLTLLVGISMSAATVVSGVAFLATGGVALCQVETPEVDLTIPVPTRLADAGLLLARLVIPEDELADARREVAPFMPMIQTAAWELANVPNGTVLVSVTTPQETVLVERRGGRLHVDVDAPDAKVHVSLPARSVARLARQLTLLF
ncbi:MAG TPA: hypothetical protein VMS86_12960 [Thermoanaerobaculia bacterium]|nr:hypothetical protein [Thermoanaerobaculia bacterium]